MKIFALLDRGGRVRSTHVRRSMYDGIREGSNQVAPESNLMTDQASTYRNEGKQFVTHEAVIHLARKWVPGAAHTDTIEGYFSGIKRRMRGD